MNHTHLLLAGLALFGAMRCIVTLPTLKAFNMPAQGRGKASLASRAAALGIWAMTMEALKGRNNLCGD